MPFTKYFDRLQSIHRLIRRRSTGTPSQFADQLGLSERQLYEYLRIMRQLGAPIAFDSYAQTYYYTQDVCLELGFKPVPLNASELEHIQGGSGCPAFVHFNEPAKKYFSFF